MNTVHQQFLNLAYERAERTNRTNVNGITIAQEMGLARNDYIRMIDDLQDAGYVYALGSMAKDVALTNAGMGQAKPSEA